MADFSFQAEDRYTDFVVVKAVYIEELRATLRELIHKPSGALIMHIENEDPENLFCLSFQTLPSSSNGAPHILEHTVLCGSKKFPVKDPFFSMNRRSLNTFMNALTGSDFTCYPAATQVEKDFYNLLEVYLDAVFHPELKKLSFLQEGHRLEFTNPKDPKSPLEYKGIVLNEMKGSMASADARMWQTLLELLVPDLPYAYNSGGNPKIIPKLSYSELLEFYKTYYHPSRCLFFFYGNLPLKKHLDFIQERTLKTVSKMSPLAPLPKQPRFTAPVFKKMRYPVNEQEDLENKTVIAFAWLTAPLMNQREVLALSVLDSILMDTDASLLKFPLLNSGLCVEVSAYMDMEMSEVPYAVACKGCKEENVEEIQKLLFDSLKEIVRSGIPAKKIETAIHQLEFSRTEITGDQSPFGLTLFMRSGLAKQHGCSPEYSLTLHALFKELLQDVEDPAYLTNLIEKHLINNPHFVRLVMKADPLLSAEEAAEEKQELSQIQKNLTKEQVQEILGLSEELSLYQKKTESQSLDCLPKVTLQDVPTFSKSFLLEQEKKGPLHIFHHSCFTNHILYADLIFDLPEIEDQDLPYVQLLTTLLPELGCGQRNYAANLEYIQSYTGGLGVGCALHAQATSPNVFNPCLNIRGKALYRNAEKLFSLFKDVSLSARFDEKKRIKELLLQMISSMQNRFNRNALGYAVQLALSGFSAAGYITNCMQGLTFFKTIQELTKNLSQHLPQLIDKLATLKEKLFCLQEPHLVLTCDEKFYKELKLQNFFGLPDLPQKSFIPWKNNYPIPTVSSQGKLIASPVAFTAQAMKSVSYLHPHAPSLTAATLLFDNKILHKQIREQGGAYGCGSGFNPMSGSFYFHSYRDPSIARTLKTFKTAIDVLAQGKFNAQDLEESKLGVIQQLDAPLSPGSRGITAYSWWREGKSFEMRQTYRENILSLKPETVQKAVAEELLPKRDSSVIISFASKELFEQENPLLKKEGLAPLPLVKV